MNKIIQLFFGVTIGMLVFGASAQNSYAQSAHDRNTNEINPLSRISEMVENLGEDRFLELAKKDPHLLKALKTGFGDFIKEDPELNSIFEKADMKSRPETTVQRKQLADSKWLESSFWYENYWAGSSMIEKVNTEQTYYMYDMDAEGYTTTEISNFYNWGVWSPEYYYQDYEAADGSYYSYKDYSDFNAQGWSYIYESEYWYNTSGFLSRASYKYTYKYSDGYEQSNYQRTYTRDENGNLLSFLDELRVDDSWHNDYRAEFAYDENGYRTKSSYFLWENSEWVPYNEYEYSYDENGNDLTYSYRYWDSSLDVWDYGYRYIYEYEGNVETVLIYPWDYEAEDWSEIPYYFYSYTYDDNGYTLEYLYQYWDDISEVWINSSNNVYTRDDEGRILTYETYRWDIVAEEWHLYYAYDYEYDENGNRIKETEDYYDYYSGDFVYSSVAVLDYDEDGDFVRETYSVKNAGETNYSYEYSYEYTYAPEMPGYTPLLNIESLTDRPDDQGGFAEMKIDGRLVDSGDSATDLYTRYWLVWVKNGTEWQNIYRSEYSGGDGTTATIPVFDTKPSGVDPDESNTFEFMVTVHGSGGALLAVSDVASGYAEDNIAPAKVASGAYSISNGIISLTWTPVEDTDVDGYHVFLLEGGNYDMSKSLAFSTSGSAEIPSPGKGNYDYVIVAKDKNNNYAEASNPISVKVITASEDTEGPQNFTLSQNYPNPFNPSTVISYQLPVSSEVSLRVFDMLGREVAVLVNGRMSAGTHKVTFNASNLSSGIYMYRIDAGSYTQIKQMMLIK